MKNAPSFEMVGTTQSQRVEPLALADAAAAAGVLLLVTPSVRLPGGTYMSLFNSTTACEVASQTSSWYHRACNDIEAAKQTNLPSLVEYRISTSSGIMARTSEMVSHPTSPD